jgi:hypothetical protein
MPRPVPCFEKTDKQTVQIAIDVSKIVQYFQDSLSCAIHLLLALQGHSAQNPTAQS